MLGCLFLWAASTDTSCIQATRNLKDAKLLDAVGAIADASIKQIKACIHACGIHYNNDFFLTENCCKLRKEFHGIVPTTEHDLTSLPGVCCMAAIHLLNEGYDFFGISTDLHIINVADVFWLFCLTFEHTKARALHFENSLCKWLPCHVFKKTNPCERLQPHNNKIIIFFPSNITYSHMPANF